MKKETVKGQVYQRCVTAAGLCLWLMALTTLATNYPVQQQLIFLALVPLMIVVGLFLNNFQLPSGLKFTSERASFTLADAIVLLVACWYGFFPAVFAAGIEGFTSARRTSRMQTSLFSSSMMSLCAAAAALTLRFVLHFGFDRQAAVHQYPFVAVAVAFLVASLVQYMLNIGLLSALLALRHNNPLTHHLKDFLGMAPMFLPTSAAASLLYFALQRDMLITLVIGGPIFLAIFLGHRQYRDSVQKRISVVEKSHRETIEALAVAINAKDEVTHEHVLRVQIYAAGVARLLGCNDSEIEALKAGALLHDIGKIAVPDYILNKPGKLTATEFEKMKLHTIVGAQILGRVEFPYPVVPVVRHHHERWDGRGYPDGLKNTDIPLTARILTVVDCFDAVREDRQYRKGMTRDEAITYLMENSGTQYDPRVVGTFITHLPEFEAEIQAHRDAPMPTFGIEPTEELSEAARMVAPAAGLAATSDSKDTARPEITHKKLGLLYDLAQALNGARGRDEVVAAFTSKLDAIVPYDVCALALASADGGEFTVTQTAGQDSELLKGRQVTVGEGVTGWVLANRQSFCNTDPKLDLPPQLAARFNTLRTLACYPVIKEDKMHGAITLYSSSLAEYNADHKRLLEEAVSLIATALSATSDAAISETKSPSVTEETASSNITGLSRMPLTLSDTVIESELAH